MKRIVLSVLATIVTVVVSTVGLYKLSMYIGTHPEESLIAVFIIGVLAISVAVFMLFYSKFEKRNNDDTTSIEN